MLYRAIYTDIPIKLLPMDKIAYFIATLIGLYLLYKLFRLAYDKSDLKPKPQIPEASSVKDVDKLKECIEKTFKRLNIEFNLHEEDESSHHYCFNFQDGFFLLEFQPAEPKYLRLIYPGVIACSLDQIDLVRIACNNINMNTNSVHSGYIIDPEENRIRVHLVMGMPMPCSATHFEEMFKLSAYDCFAINTHLQKDYSSLLEDCNNYQSTDVEFVRARNEAIQYLLEEASVKFTEETFALPRKAAYDPRPLSLQEFLNGTCLLDNAHLTELEVTGQELSLLLTDESDIRNYALAAALTDKQGMDTTTATTFERTDAAIRIKAWRPVGAHREEGIKDVCLYLMLHAEYQNDHTLYYRLTYCSPTKETGRAYAASEMVQQSLRSSGSMLLGLDLKTDKEKQAEFDYLWDEAKEQCAQNNLDGLNKEQLLIAQIQNADEAQNLYRGTRLMRERRFFEAAHYLEKAWNYANRNALSKRRLYLATYHQTSFLYGLCLYRLGNYKLAHFYLHESDIDENLQHAKLWVNCNIKLGNAGALEEIRKMQLNCGQQMEVQQNENGTLPDELVNFGNYLARCEIHLLINSNLLQQAEEMCLRLLRANVSTEFAKERLAQIKALRLQAATKVKKNTQDVENDTPHDENSTPRAPSDLPQA